MDLLSREKLTSLTEYKNDICVSLYMPALRTNPEKQQNPIRYKNLFRKAEDILFERGSRAEQVDEVLDPGRSLISDDLFWSFLQSDGFCAFLSAGDISYFRLPVHFKESVTVADRYYLKPLLGFLYNDSRFFLLAAGLGSVKLYQCTRHSINEIPLENTPANYKEATKYSHIDRELEFHTHTSTEKFPGWTHGQGGGEDGKKTEIMEYFKMIAHGVSNVICQDNAPLLFAGLEEHFGMFRKANNYLFLVKDSHLAYDPERLKSAELHSRAAQIMEKHFVMTRDHAIGSYLDRAGTGHTASDIETILPAAFEGRVETLFVPPDSIIWGTFDPGQRKISVHDNPGADDRDLMDLACIYTYSKGGAVYEIASRDLGIEPPAAIFRY
ncbi:MAG: baeRF7 domain-containing protein [Syntrophorhabdaceae bacterium]